MGFYHFCQALGNMLSGALQAGIMSTLDGSSEIAGWRGLLSSTASSRLLGDFWV